MKSIVLRSPGGLDRLPSRAYEFATLRFAIKGRASHAGVAPALGINAVVEAAAQLPPCWEGRPATAPYWRS